MNLSRFFAVAGTTLQKSVFTVTGQLMNYGDERIQEFLDWRVAIQLFWRWIFMRDKMISATFTTEIRRY